MPLGDVIYRGASVWKRLVGNTTTTRKFLRQVGDGVDSAAPSWQAVAAGDLSHAVYDAGNSGASKTLDWSDGPVQLLTLTDNATLTLSNPQSGATYRVALRQDGTGSRTVTWPSSVKWPSATAPTLSTTAGAVDVIELTYFAGLGASGNYLARAVLNYAPA